MNPLEMAILEKLCRTHNLDTQLIDHSLTYYENKKYLLSLIPKTDQDLIREGESQKEQYMQEHFLTYYVSVNLK